MPFQVSPLQLADPKDMHPPNPSAAQITVLVTTLLLQAYIIALLVLKFTRHQTLAVLQQQHRWFKAQLILYAVTMLATLYVGIRLAARLRLIRKQPQKVWWVLVLGGEA